jgi:hypothetical protein
MRDVPFPELDAQKLTEPTCPVTGGGTRSVHFRLGEPLPEAELGHCIALAMTCHLKKS